VEDRQWLRVPGLGGLAQRGEAFDGEIAAAQGGRCQLRLVALGGQGDGGAIGPGVGEERGRQGQDGVARLGQPAVLHEDVEGQVTVVDQAVDGPGREPHQGPGRQGRLLEAGSGQGLHGAAAAGHRVPLRTGQVHMGSSAAPPVGGRPVVHPQP
jgi:hypothetical protein